MVRVWCGLPFLDLTFSEFFRRCNGGCGELFGAVEQLAKLFSDRGLRLADGVEFDVSFM